MCELLGVQYPILQAGIPWVSNPELVAAVSEAGGVGVLHPTAGLSVKGELSRNLRQNIRAVMRVTREPFGVCFNLSYPQVARLIKLAVEEGVRTVVTKGGSPAQHMKYLKNNGCKVLHQVGSIQHARSAEAEGVDIVIVEGLEMGGPLSPEALPNLALVPQVVDAVSVPVVASGGIVDSRGYAAALVLGADGVQVGTRFIATHECVAHPRFKEALLKAVDTGTFVAGVPEHPKRLLRRPAAEPRQVGGQRGWEGELESAMARAALVEGNLEEGMPYCGAGVGLITGILSAKQVIDRMVQGLKEAVPRLQ